MSKNTKHPETPDARKKRLAAARAAKAQEQLMQEQMRLEAEANAAAERRRVMPTVLFNLMVQVKELQEQGLEVSAQVVLKSFRYSYQVAEPGVEFLFSDYNDDQYYLTQVSEEWEVEVVKEILAQLQQKAAEKRRQRELAEAAKAKLTPEELAALRQHYV